MDKPIFEIPVNPSGDDYDGLESWAPAPSAPPVDSRPSFESLLAELAEQSAAPLPPVATPVNSWSSTSAWSLEARAADEATAAANDSIESIDALFAAADNTPTSLLPVVAVDDDSPPYLIPVPPTAFSPRFDLAPPPPPVAEVAPTYQVDAAPYLIPTPQVAIVETVVAPAFEAVIAPIVETDVPVGIDLAEPVLAAPVLPAAVELSTETPAFAVQALAATEFPPQSAADSFEQEAPRLVPSGRRAAASSEPETPPAIDDEINAAITPAITPAIDLELHSAIDYELDTTLPLTSAPALKQADPDLIAALHEVVYQNASDLHVTVGAPPSIRVDGGLRGLEGTNKWMVEKVKTALYSLLTDAQKEKFEREHELDFAYAAGGARFRVNYYLQRNSVGGAFRLIPREIKPLKDLGVPETVGRFSTLARGLVLVTGPTGSGKSTTLAALIDLVNRTRADHIVTVEDPIEFLHQHQKSLVNQREVGHDTHSFAAALKHVLRQDPDVILIGELRDLETISVALTAAETGHLVFATLHTQDAAQTIDRVIDVFPPHQQGQVRAQLAATLQGVVCQTLVKKASGRGRVVATEILTMTPAIANLIREGKTYQIASMMQAGRDSGMHTMDQHLADLVNSGQITRRAAEDKAHDPAGLTRLIHRVESPTESSARAMAASGIDFGDSYSQVAH